KAKFSDPYIQALQEKAIPYFCPRTSPYFLYDEVCLMIGCLTWIFDFAPNQGIYASADPFSDYLTICKEQLQKPYLSYPHFPSTLQHIREEIAQSTRSPEIQGKPLLDFFYRLITTSPFLPYIKGTRSREARPQNLELLSHLLQTFQRHYRTPNT